LLLPWSKQLKLLKTNTKMGIRKLEPPVKQKAKAKPEVKAPAKAKVKPEVIEDEEPDIETPEPAKPKLGVEPKKRVSETIAVQGKGAIVAGFKKKCRDMFRGESAVLCVLLDKYNKGAIDIF
jgi:hypothetical protein